MIKILNAYCGLGGNREKWGGDGLSVTAVEKDERIASVYKSRFPNDKVVVGDAHSYIKDNMNEFDFIWTSPPCPTHSLMNTTLVGRGQIQPRYPDMKLWQEIILLKQFFKGGFVVENVIPYYEIFIPGHTLIERHYFWTNFKLRKPREKFITGGLIGGKKWVGVSDWQEMTGINLDGSGLSGKEKVKVYRNMVNPDLGSYVFDSWIGSEEQKYPSSQLKFNLR